MICLSPHIETVSLYGETTDVLRIVTIWLFVIEKLITIATRFYFMTGLHDVIQKDLLEYEHSVLIAVRFIILLFISIFHMIINLNT